MGVLTPNTMHAPEGAEFSKELGVIYRPTVLKPVTDAHHWMLIWEDFTEVVVRINRHGSARLWKEFRQRLDAQLRAYGFGFVHELVFECLKFIDTWRTRNGMTIRKFVDGGFYHSDVLGPFEKAWSVRENDDGGGVHSIRTPQGKNVKVDKQKFGPVTKQGEFCEDKQYWAVNPTSGKRSICNKFNSGQPCDKGVFDGPCKGQCAYWHVCKYCKAKGHYGEEKDTAGAWVCQKHP